MTSTFSQVFRCFVAVGLPQPAKDFLARFVNEAAREFTGYRFGKVENLHLTLQFLGDVEQTASSALEEALLVAASAVHSFSTGLGGAGCFPMRGTPRILHIELGTGAAEIMSLAGVVSRELSKLGYRPDKTFAPHITLGRSRSRDGRPAGALYLRSKTTDNSAPVGFEGVSNKWKNAFSRHVARYGKVEPWVTGEVLLMESVLRPDGPIYIQRGSAKLD